MLTEFIPGDERIVTIEEMASLQIRHSHVVSLQSHPADAEGKGAVTMRDLIRSAAGMRPERLICGEFLGDGILDALQLMGRGHDGSMLTVHAGSISEALEQLEMLIMFNRSDLPVQYLRRLIGSTINLIVQINRLHDGSRKITAVSEVVPDRQEGYLLRDLIVYQQTGLNERGKIAGNHRPFPISEQLAQRMRWLDLTLPLAFWPQEASQ
jgi:pilus assembly protein CpaF